MVNIQAIVVVSDSQTRMFGNYDDYWNHVMTSASSVWKQKMIRVKALADRAELEFAELYEVPAVNLKNVCFIFGTAANTRRQLLDPHTRELVFNLDHRIVINLRRSQGRCNVIAVIYRPFDHQIIESSFIFRPGQTGNQEP